jgi:hypothetical protein
MSTRYFFPDIPLMMTWVFSSSKIAWRNGDIATMLDWLRTGLFLEEDVVDLGMRKCQEVNRLILVNQGFLNDSMVA